MRVLDHQRTSSSSVVNRVLIFIIYFGFVSSALAKMDVVTRPQIRAIIFDLDGTLLDTETLSSVAIQRCLDSVGCEQEFTWDLRKKLFGLRGPDWSAMVVDELNIRDRLEPARLVAEWEVCLNQLCNDVGKIPGAEDLTRTFAEKQLPMAIATSSRWEAVRVKRSKHEEMFKRMAFVVSGDDAEVKNGKPAPDIYLIAAKRLGIEPQYCLAFEDALSGVQSARRAGMHVCACPDPRLDVGAFMAETPYILPRASLEGFDFDVFDFVSPNESTITTNSTSASTNSTEGNMGRS